MTSDDSAPVGLRERRRRETLREVADAALTLFEERGVAATTVDEIAAAAGISPRTFFRYYPTKEHALFHEDEEYRTIRVALLDDVRGGADLAAAIEHAWVRLFDDFDRRPDIRARVLRVRRVIESEPTLLARAVTNDIDNADELIDAAVEAAGADVDVLTTRATVAAMDAIIRVVFGEWVRRSELGDAASAGEIYREVIAGLAPLGAHLSRDAGK